MRSSSIPRSLILVASAALSFGACATQTDPGGTGATSMPAATAAGAPSSAASAGMTGAAAAAGKPATGATAGGTPTATGTGGTTATATAGTPATATAGAAATPAGAAGMSAAAAGTSGGAAGGGAAMGGAPTFTRVYEEVLTGTGCSVGACHGSAMAASRLGLADKTDAYMQLIGIKAMGMPNPGSMGTGCKDMDFVRVKAGDPDNSLLVQKLENKQKCGDAMPPPTGMLKPEVIKLVRDWIMAGAKND